MHMGMTPARPRRVQPRRKSHFQNSGRIGPSAERAGDARAARPYRPGGVTFFLKIRRFGSRASLAEGDSKTDEIDSVGGSHHESVCRTRELDFIIPAATTEYFDFALRWAGWVHHV